MNNKEFLSLTKELSKAKDALSRRNVLIRTLRGQIKFLKRKAS